MIYYEHPEGGRLINLNDSYKNWKTSFSEKLILIFRVRRVGWLMFFNGILG